MQGVVEQPAGGVARSVVEGHEPVADRCLQRVLHAPESGEQGFPRWPGSCRCSQGCLAVFSVRGGS